MLRVEQLNEAVLLLKKYPKKIDIKKTSIHAGFFVSTLSNGLGQLILLGQLHHAAVKRAVNVINGELILN